MSYERARPFIRKPRPRKPESNKGSAIRERVRACKPLDENSAYCDRVQADHFRDTCVVAELESEKARGLGRRMLAHLVARDECADALSLETTITADKGASSGLLRVLARSIGGRLADPPHFRRDDHFDGRHDTEHLVSIPPPRAARLDKAA